MNYIVVIPARSGSKGIKNKNIKTLKDKPLINYTIEQALSVFDKTKICVSTDSVEIINIATAAGIEVPFVRPKALASDTAGSRDVLLHAIDYFEQKSERSLDFVVLLQPTSPFRKPSDITACLELWTEEIDMVASVKRATSNPYYNLYEEDTLGFLGKSKNAEFTRRQDVPHVWEINGAIYVISVAAIKKFEISEFKRVVKYEMDEYSSLDIDTNYDWLIAEYMMEYLGK